MFVEINNTGNDLLHVYKVHNRQMRSTDTRPLCSIWEDDFLELLTVGDYMKATQGTKIHFDISEAELRNKAKTIFQ